MKSHYNPFAHTFASRKAQLETRLARLVANLAEARNMRRNGAQNSGLIVGLNIKIGETREALARL